MPLHPVAQQLLDDAVASDRPNAHLLPLAEARANFEATFGALDVEDVARVEDFDVEGAGGLFRVRLYKPVAAEKLPLVVYIHGGGFQMGSIDSHEGISRAIANATGQAVLSVGYRRPPEHKFPTAPADCYAALVWAIENCERLGLDSATITVAGDSAGGNLAAAVALQARDRGFPRIACQALIYPASTFDLDAGFNLDYEGWVLFRDEIQWHKDAYFDSAADSEHDYASPLNADLRGLPPALVITAEYDPLGVAGVALARKLEASQVETRHVDYPGMIHGFIQFPGLFEEATGAVECVSSFIKMHTIGA